MIRKDAILVDVGVTRVDGKIIGDIAQDCQEKCSYITPNPGGVGPMTVAMIIDNLIEMKGNN
ncbi:bifunctional methylenetetrahydrofolate dehydrogenase/methenyltetrahydrofolate cyclohydrolase, partial [bacterium]|nr:bifunctional methylenetetrahydrofolate dehydrogenase/methenyltetrahydrofolate cyclohydrolase [bacterium]